MTRKRADKGWMARHVRDPYVQRAVRQGYRSRAAFKLRELDARDRLLRPGGVVLDLGAAPGGWSQVAARAVGAAGKVIAVDTAPMEPIAGVCFIRGDLRVPSTRARIEEALAGSRVDLVLSDMAPNLSGVAPADEARAQELVEAAVDLSAVLLKPDGALLVKMFHGSGLDAVNDRMRAVFRTVLLRKPRASRSGSREVYAVCRGPVAR